MKYWLMKSEPGSYSIDDLKIDKVEGWDGVRNYQARNFMRDDMEKGDKVIFYHSNSKPPGAAGICTIHETGVVDHTQFDPMSKYYDPKATLEDPRWIMVEVKFEKKFDRLVSIEEMRSNPDLKDMRLLEKGSRLSVLPITKKEFQIIEKMSKL